MRQNLWNCQPTVYGPAPTVCQWYVQRDRDTFDSADPLVTLRLSLCPYSVSITWLASELKLT